MESVPRHRDGPLPDAGTGGAVVFSQGLGGGAAASIRANLGILTGNALYFLLSATGLGAILLASYDLFFCIKWVGAAYLVWLGLRALWATGTVLATAPAVGAATSGRVFARAFAVQAANPKAIVFFTALLPQFIDPAGSVPFQVAILAATSIAVEFAVLAMQAPSRAGSRGSPASRGSRRSSIGPPACC